MLKFVKDKTSFISGICLILLSLILFYEASSLSPFGSVFPYSITAALLILSVILIFRSFKLEIKVINEKVSFIKIPLLIVTFFGWILNRAGFKASPIVLGLVLGQIAEQGFVQAYIIGSAQENIFANYFARPISIVLVFFIIMGLFLPTLKRIYNRRKNA